MSKEVEKLTKREIATLTLHGQLVDALYTFNGSKRYLVTPNAKLTREMVTDNIQADFKRECSNAPANARLLYVSTLEDNDNLFDIDQRPFFVEEKVLIRPIGIVYKDDHDIAQIVYRGTSITPGFKEFKWSTGEKHAFVNQESTSWKAATGLKSDTGTVRKAIADAYNKNHTYVGSLAQQMIDSYQGLGCPGSVNATGHSAGAPLAMLSAASCIAKGAKKALLSQISPLPSADRQSMDLFRSFGIKNRSFICPGDPIYKLDYVPGAFLRGLTADMTAGNFGDGTEVIHPSEHFESKFDLFGDTYFGPAFYDPLKAHGIAAFNDFIKTPAFVNRFAKD